MSNVISILKHIDNKKSRKLLSQLEQGCELPKIFNSYFLPNI